VRTGKVGSAPTGIALDYRGRFDAWLPKLSVHYQAGDAATFGALIQRAYNPGGTSISLARRAEDSFAAEALWNYEAFVRSTFAGGRGSLAANLFYNDIENAQRQQLVPVPAADGGTVFATEFANAPRARTYGAEAELRWRSGDRLSLRVGMALLRTQVRRTVLATDPTLGKDFQRSPRFSAAAGVDWRPLDPLRLSASLRHHGRYFSDDANALSRQINRSTMVDLRASYDAGPVTFLGYARNALDSFALNYLFTPTFGTASDPRELGIGIESNF
jgi:iron complex outermembrane recepter protein